MAVTTITTTGAEDARIVVAFGKRLGLPGNASQAQVKADIVRYVRQVVYEEEAAAARVAAVAPIVEIAPT